MKTKSILTAVIPRAQIPPTRFTAGSYPPPGRLPKAALSSTCPPTAFSSMLVGIMAYNIYVLRPRTIAFGLYFLHEALPSVVTVIPDRDIDLLHSAVLNV